MRRPLTNVVLAFAALAITACAGKQAEDNTADKAPEVLEVVDYHDNGMLSKRGMTVDGKRHGTWESWYPDGLKWSETTFRNGVKQGPTVTFFPNGMMRYSGHYHDDTRSGLWQLYDTNGVLITRIDMDLDPTRGDSLINKSMLGH